MKIEFLLTLLSNFEREAPLKDSAKVLKSAYNLIINLIGLAWQMVWYIQSLLWCVVQWGRKMGKRWRTWWGFCWRGFQLARVKFDIDGERGREDLGMGYCSSPFQCLYSKDSLYNFNFAGKTVPFLYTDITMVVLLCFSSVFLRSERYPFNFFCSPIFWIKL